MRLPLRIAVAAVLLALALVGLVIREGMARDAGQEVVLAINAYDPRSPLSGHYAAFQIQDELPVGTACPTGVDVADSVLSRRDSEGWVALKRAGDRYRVSGAASDHERAQALGEVTVRGVATCRPGVFVTVTPDGTTIVRGSGVAREKGPTVSLRIGVDRFHADQQEAEAIERNLRGASATPAFVVVSVGRDGKARLKGIIVGDKRTDLTWL